MQFHRDLLDVSSLGGGRPSCAPYVGLKALMLAVLDNGISCYLGSMARVRAEAEHWIDTKARRSLFSFTVVCETLDLEPDAVRVALQRLRNKNASPSRPFGRSRQNVRAPGRLLARKAG
jgi:hypothetical protein